MIDPDLGGILKLDQIFALRWVVEVQVAKNHVGLRLHSEAAVGESCTGRLLVTSSSNERWLYTSQTQCLHQ